MKFWGWYLKIAVGSALIGGSMEYFMIKSGFCVACCYIRSIHFYYKVDPANDKVTVLESEKRAWDNSPESQAMRDALNPWKNHREKAGKDN